MSNGKKWEDCIYHHWEDGRRLCSYNKRFCFVLPWNFCKHFSKIPQHTKIAEERRDKCPLYNIDKW